MEASFELSSPLRISQKYILIAVFLKLSCNLGSMVIAFLPFYSITHLNLHESPWVEITIAILAILILESLYIGAALYYIPVVNANFYIRNLLNNSLQPPHPEQQSIISQVAFTPRLQQNKLLARFEDADDFGYMTITDEGFIYTGIHIKFTLPYTAIKNAHIKNLGYVKMWLEFEKITLETDFFEEVQNIQFCERTSNTVLQHQKISQAMIFQITKAMPGKVNPEY